MYIYNLREFGLCTLPSSLLRTGARPEVSSEPRLVTHSQTCFFLLICYVFQQLQRRRVRVLAFSVRTHDVVLSFGWRDAWSLKS